MSKRRQHFIGGFFGTLVGWGMIVFLVWWLPELLLRFFPEWRIISQDPWLLVPTDLTWRRVLVNAATKPGFRVLLAVLGGLVMIVGSRLVLALLMPVKRVIPRLALFESAEWVVEGRRSSSLSEYGHWLQVV